MSPHRPIDPDRLNRAIELARITPKQLAEKVGISLQYMCDITSGHRRLKRSPDLVGRIAEALEVPPDWIQIQRAEAA